MAPSAGGGSTTGEKVGQVEMIAMSNDGLSEQGRGKEWLSFSSAEDKQETAWRIS